MMQINSESWPSIVCDEQLYCACSVVLALNFVVALLGSWLTWCNKRQRLVVCVGKINSGLPVCPYK